MSQKIHPLRVLKITTLCFGVVLFFLAGCSGASHYGYGQNLSQWPSQPGRTQLKIQAFQQTTDYTCGPAALLTLIRYYGQDGDEMQIARQVKSNAEKGTHPANIAAWLRERGFDANFHENGSLEMLRENLQKGRPTLVEWIDWGGHWVLVIGYDTIGTETLDDDVILFADPADCCDGCIDGITYFNAQRFDSMWFDAFLFEKTMKKLYVTAIPITK